MLTSHLLRPWWGSCFEGQRSSFGATVSTVGRYRTSAGWGRVFAIASTVTPFLLGTAIGAIASGAVGSAATRVPGASFTAVYVTPWAGAVPARGRRAGTGVVFLLAAVYLTVHTTDDALREDFRRRALLAAAAVFVAAFGTLALARGRVPRLDVSSLAQSWTFGLHLITGAAALITIWGLWFRRYRVARVGVVVQVSCIPLGLGRVSVSLGDPGLSDHRCCGGAAIDDRGVARCSGRWRIGPRSFARLPVSPSGTRRAIGNGLVASDLRAHVRSLRAYAEPSLDQAGLRPSRD